MDSFIDALKFHLNVTLREKMNPFFAKGRRNKIANGKEKIYYYFQYMLGWSCI